MDMNDLYLVAVRLSGWEFMADASHNNAKKAVRGFASDLQDFHEQGQRSSAAQLMQQGASAVAVAAVEDAPQQGLAFDQQALVSAMTTAISSSISNTMTTAMTVILQTNTAAFGATMNSALENNNAVMTALVTKMEHRVDSVEASADAKLAKIADVLFSAEAKIAEGDAKLAEAESKIEENKVEAESKIADLKDVVDKVVDRLALFGAGARAAAGDRGAGGPVRTYQKYTAAARKKTLEWMLRHSSHPYPTPAELEKLRKETGIDTPKRMSALLVQIRTKDMEKDNTGVWRQRVIQPSTSKKSKMWTQKNIKDWM